MQALSTYPAMTNSIVQLYINDVVYPTFCVVTNGWQAWALIMKIDGNQNNFLYANALWSNKLSFNDAAVYGGLDSQEYKSPLYWQYPFTTIRMGMNGSRASMAFNTITYWTSSLFAVIADGGVCCSSLFMLSVLMTSLRCFCSLPWCEL
jgi:hypothetical protein